MTAVGKDEHARGHGGERSPIPHEHGAWGLVLQPFAAAAILAWQWNWLLLPALLLTLLGFLIREPLTILARQRWAGHSKDTQARIAKRWLAVELAGILICFLIMLPGVPWQPLCSLMGAGFVLTLVSVWFAVKNRQRSVGLQIAAVTGLGSSALIAALASVRVIPAWAWLLWSLLTLHGIVSVLCVHARLQMRIAAARDSGGSPRLAATRATILQLAAAFPAAAFGGPGLAIPVLFSAAIHGNELLRLSNPRHIRERLQRVGYRMLGLSLGHLALTIIVLWPQTGA